MYIFHNFKKANKDKNLLCEKPLGISNFNEKILPLARHQMCNPSYLVLGKTPLTKKAQEKSLTSKSKV
jgi:hypothetical protein